jgi:hypothetical protein
MAAALVNDAAGHPVSHLDERPQTHDCMEMRQCLRVD